MYIQKKNNQKRKSTKIDREIQKKKSNKSVYKKIQGVEDKGIPGVC